jgi:hypothetical protein
MIRLIQLAIFLLGLMALSPVVFAENKLLKPTNVAQVNTAADEDEPHLSSNGLTLWYASNGKKKFDILVSRRANAGQPWTAGKLVGDYIQTDLDDKSAFLTVDGQYPQYLYFATKKDKEINNFDIYVAVRQGPRAAFSAPTPLNALGTEADELHPWLTNDGKDLYFSRKTKDGWCVFVSRRDSATGAAGFGDPTLLADLPPGFHHATLTPEGKTMYLQGPLEKDRWGLFRSTRTAKTWSKPEPLTTLNHPDGATGDRSPNLSRDGFWLYFASDRPGGKGGLDLWMIRTSELRK